MQPGDLSEGDIAQICREAAEFLRQGRDRYASVAVPLTAEQRRPLAGFFPSDLLDRVRVAELHGERISNPDLPSLAKVAGRLRSPEMPHMNSITFDDVIVAHQELTPRMLFHALVHATQFAVLGLERYADLYSRAFLRTGAHLTVPLEMQAFELEARFAAAPGSAFSVEDEVCRALAAGRY